MVWQEDLRISIETKFKNEFDLIPQQYIDYGDTEKSFNKPTDKSPFCRVSINIITTENAELGTKFQRVRGVLTVQCFTQAGTGEKKSNLLTGKVGDIFQNKNFDSIQFFTMEPVKVGNDSGWFQQNANLDFLFDVFS